MVMFIVQEGRRDNNNHFPDGVMLGVGQTIFDTQWSGPWTLGSKNDPSWRKHRYKNTLPFEQSLHLLICVTE